MATPRRWPCSRRPWSATGRSPTTRAATPPSCRACPRPRCTASPPSTTTWSSLAASATWPCAPAPRAGPRTPATTQRSSASAWAWSSASGPRTARCPTAPPSAWASATARRPTATAAWSMRGRARWTGWPRARPSRPPEPEGRTMLGEPVLLAGGSFGGLRRALSDLSPEELLGGGQGRQPARPRRRGVPRRHQVVVRQGRRRRGKAHRRQRRRGRPRLLHRQAPDGAVPAAAAGGHGAGGVRGRLRARADPGALGVPRLHTDPARGDRAGIRRGRARRRHPRQRLLLPRAGRGGRRLLRGGRGDRAAGIAPGPARHGERAAAVPGPARLARQADGGQQRGDAVQRALHRGERRGRLQGAVAGRHAGREAGVPERAVRQPRRLRGPVRHAGLPHLQRAGRRARTAGRSRRSRSAGRWAGCCPHWLLDRRWTSTTWPSTAAWLATDRSWPSTRTPTCASCAATCSSSAPTRAVASASRAGSGSSGRSRCPRRPATSTAKSSRRCWRRWSWARCARTAGACRRRSAR